MARAGPLIALPKLARASAVHYLVRNRSATTGLKIINMGAEVIVIRWK